MVGYILFSNSFDSLTDRDIDTVEEHIDRPYVSFLFRGLDFMDLVIPH
jgi:hypothetical protein